MVKDSNADFSAPCSTITYFHIDEPDFYRESSFKLLTLNVLHWMLNVLPNLSIEYLPKQEASSLLQDNLLSPFQKIRVKSLQILSIYEEERFETNFPDLALKCERISLDLQNYREKIRLYTKLSASEYETLLPSDGDKKSFKALTIKFLLGQLNVNFTLLTPALNQVIETHARLQTSIDFWEIFGHALNLAHKNVTTSIEKYETFELSASTERQSKFSKSLILKLSNCDKIGHENEQKELLGKIASNYANFRLLLWKSMENFADLAQSKSRFLSELILNLAETLISCLTVYSKFNDIKSIAKEKQLKTLYFQIPLLMHGRPDVQKAALDCILAYKSNSLEQYRSHLSGLLNDKQFKDELVLFNIDSEVNVLQAEHRTDVIPILLRLLYGRLLGKGSNENRKRQIYRFLASCQANELSCFLDYLFAPLGDILSDDNILLNCDHVMKTYDFSKSISFRKIKGVLTHLSSVIKQLGFTLDSTYRSKLLRICLILGSIFGKIQAERQNIHAHFVKMSKKLRNELIARITEFCEHFENYPFESSEIEGLFVYCLNHVTEKSECFALLSNETLKLCTIWSGIPRFFPMLAVYLPHKTDKTLLQLLIESLNDENLPVKSRDLISQIIFNLITTADFSPVNQQRDNDDEPKPGPILEFSSQFSRKIIDEENTMQLNFGTQILLPYSNVLLKFISRKCAAVASDKRNGKSSPTLCRNEKWMKILQVLTESAPKAENAVQLLTILFDVLKAKTVKNPAIEADLVKSVDCLLRSVDDKTAFLSNVIECFRFINNRQSRDNLIVLFDRFTQDCATLKEISGMINDLNSWNPKRLDEPDYDRRLVAFSKFNKLLKNDSSFNFSDVHSWLMSNNCLYTIVQVDDMSLRDNAGHSLRLLIEYLHQRYDESENRAFLTLKILPCIKDNLKSRNEV
uniref:U3 small nucleolar RNA-associated protein 20 N-terminal domain-containing protein n=1 Tax=Romanomermis culicivorax TaxID=13658 RepID=A0A915I2K4_ROMCU